jgi:hypothetical protein
MATPDPEFIIAINPELPFDPVARNAHLSHGAKLHLISRGSAGAVQVVIDTHWYSKDFVDADLRKIYRPGFGRLRFHSRYPLRKSCLEECDEECNIQGRYKHSVHYLHSERCFHEWVDICTDHILLALIREGGPGAKRELQKYYDEVLLPAEDKPTAYPLDVHFPEHIGRGIYDDGPAAPPCPDCGGQMELYKGMLDKSPDDPASTVTTGGLDVWQVDFLLPGELMWVCRHYPDCEGMVPFKEDEYKGDWDYRK